MSEKREERLPQAVEDKLQEAYERIRKGEVKQQRQTAHIRRSWTGIAAACAVFVAASAGVIAAAAYFQKDVSREADRLTYEFDLNYELVPGEYTVTPGYLPEGYIDRGDGKYDGGDWLGITVFPIYSTAELDRMDGELALNAIEKVEHTTLSGMEADVLTFKGAKSPTNIILFDASQGFVLRLWAADQVEREEFLRFADHLSVTRTGDAAYETAEEKETREQEEDEEARNAETGRRNHAALIEAGIPQEKIYRMGEELTVLDGAIGYTVTDFRYLESIEGFPEEKFVDYSRFDGWLNEDKTLKPYTRRHISADGGFLEEEEAEQEFLQVDVTVHCYDSTVFEEVPLNFERQYVTKRPDGSCTWAQDRYEAGGEKPYELQMDQSAVYLDQAIHTEGADRKSFYFCKLEDGEELSYTLLFVVDRDRKEDYLLFPQSGNGSIWQEESMTAEEMREALDGYVRLE